MKPRWKSVWITPAASGAVAPAGIVQARDSLGPAVRNVDRPRASNERPGQLGQAGLAEAKLGKQLGGLVLGQFRQLCLGLGVEEDRLGRLDQRRQPVAQIAVGKLGVIGVEHIQQRLGRQQLEVAQVSRVDSGRCRAGEQCRPAVEDLLRFDGGISGA